MPPETSPATPKKSRSLGRPLDATDWSYLLGLILLAIGISLRVSVETALIVVGAILTFVSCAASFFVTWLSAARPKEK